MAAFADDGVTTANWYDAELGDKRPREDEDESDFFPDPLPLFSTQQFDDDEAELLPPLKALPLIETGHGKNSAVIPEELPSGSKMLKKRRRDRAMEEVLEDDHEGQDDAGGREHKHRHTRKKSKKRSRHHHLGELPSEQLPAQSMQGSATAFDIDADTGNGLTNGSRDPEGPKQRRKRRHSSAGENDGSRETKKKHKSHKLDASEAVHGTHTNENDTEDVGTTQDALQTSDGAARMATVVTATGSLATPESKSESESESARADLDLRQNLASLPAVQSGKDDDDEPTRKPKIPVHEEPDEETIAGARPSSAKADVQPGPKNGASKKNARRLSKKPFLNQPNDALDSAQAPIPKRATRSTQRAAAKVELSNGAMSDPESADSKRSSKQQNDPTLAPGPASRSRTRSAKQVAATGPTVSETKKSKSSKDAKDTQYVEQAPTGPPVDATAEEPATNILHGRFTVDERSAIQRALETFRVAKNMTQYEVNNLIHTKGGTAAGELARELWSDLIAALPRRTRQKVINTVRKMYHNFVARATWTPEQDQELRDAVEELGMAWVNISARINRHPEDIRDRWRNYLVCGDSRATTIWSDEEELRLVKAVMPAMDSINQKRLEDPDNKALRAPYEELIDWQGISADLDRTRSRLQCMTKWKTMAIPLRGTEPLVSQLPGSAVSWPLEKARRQLGAMTNADKFALVDSIRQSGVRSEPRIPWRSLVSKAFRFRFTRFTMCLFWLRLQRVLPRELPAGDHVRAAVSHLLEHYDNERGFGEPGDADVDDGEENAVMLQIEAGLPKFWRQKKQNLLSEEMVHESDREASPVDRGAVDDGAVVEREVDVEADDVEADAAQEVAITAADAIEEADEGLVDEEAADEGAAADEVNKRAQSTIKKRATKGSTRKEGEKEDGTVSAKKRKAKKSHSSVEMKMAAPLGQSDADPLNAADPPSNADEPWGVDDRWGMTGPGNSADSWGAADAGRVADHENGADSSWGNAERETNEDGIDRALARNYNVIHTPPGPPPPGLPPSELEAFGGSDSGSNSYWADGPATGEPSESIAVSERTPRQDNARARHGRMGYESASASSARRRGGGVPFKEGGGLRAMPADVIEDSQVMAGAVKERRLSLPSSASDMEDIPARLPDQLMW